MLIWRLFSIQTRGNLHLAGSIFPTIDQKMQIVISFLLSVALQASYVADRVGAVYPSCWSYLSFNLSLMSVLQDSFLSRRKFQSNEGRAISASLAPSTCRSKNVNWRDCLTSGQLSHSPRSRRDDDEITRYLQLYWSSNNIVMPAEQGDARQQDNSPIPVTDVNLLCLIACHTEHRGMGQPRLSIRGRMWLIFVHHPQKHQFRPFKFRHDSWQTSLTCNQTSLTCNQTSLTCNQTSFT